SFEGGVRWGTSSVFRLGWQSPRSGSIGRRHYRVRRRPRARCRSRLSQLPSRVSPRAGKRLMDKLGGRISVRGDRGVSSSAFRPPYALWVLVVVAFIQATPPVAFASGEERTTVGDDLLVRTDTRWAGGAVGGYLPVRVEISNQAGARSLVFEITPSDRAHGATVRRVVGVDEHATVRLSLPLPLTAFRQWLLR